MRDFKGYIQLSRKYRTIGKLPEGRTGLEMLRETNPILVKNWEDNLEQQAAEHFLRVYSIHYPKYQECSVELSVEEFDEFLAWKNETNKKLES